MAQQNKTYISPFFKIAQDSVNISTPATNSYIQVPQIQKEVKEENPFSIPVMVSIGIFILGFIANEALRRYNKRHELENRREIIFNWFDKTNDTINLYTDHLEMFIKDIKENDDLNIAKWTSNHIPITRLNDFSLEQYSSTFIKNIKSSDIKENRERVVRLLFQVEYIDKVQEGVIDVYNSYCVRNEKIRSEWNCLYCDLINTTASSSSIVLTETETSIINEFHKLITDIQGVTDITIWETSFITPSMHILGNNPEKSVLIFNLLMLTNKLRIVILEYKAHKDFANVFKDYLDNIKSSQKELNESIDYLKAQELRCFFRIK